MNDWALRSNKETYDDMEKGWDAESSVFFTYKPPESGHYPSGSETTQSFPEPLLDDNVEGNVDSYDDEDEVGSYEPYTDFEGSEVAESNLTEDTSSHPLTPLNSDDEETFEDLGWLATAADLVAGQPTAAPQAAAVPQHERNPAPKRTRSASTATTKGRHGKRPKFATIEADYERLERIIHNCLEYDYLAAAKCDESINEDTIRQQYECLQHILNLAKDARDRNDGEAVAGLLEAALNVVPSISAILVAASNKEPAPTVSLLNRDRWMAIVDSEYMHKGK